VMSLLTINGGSSSIRFALYDGREPLRQLLDGKVDRVGLSGTNLTFNDAAATLARGSAGSAPLGECGPSRAHGWRRSGTAQRHVSQANEIVGASTQSK
jgi:hypothetical protein